MNPDDKFSKTKIFFDIIHQTFEMEAAEDLAKENVVHKYAINAAKQVFKYPTSEDLALNIFYNIYETIGDYPTSNNSAEYAKKYLELYEITELLLTEKNYNYQQPPF